jgi:hypothetical protein
VPHLVELHLHHQQVTSQVSVERFSLPGRTPARSKHSTFRRAAHKTNARKINKDQGILKSIMTFSIEKDCLVLTR